MISYKILYQTRRRAGKAGCGEGSWQDKEKVVVVCDDARDAVDEVVRRIVGFDFRLRGIKIIGQVDAIVDGLS